MVCASSPSSNRTRRTPARERTIKALQGEIERLEREIALLDERLRSVAERQGWLSTLGDQAARSLAWGIARGSTKPEDASGLFAYADEQAQYLASSRQEIQTTRDETQRTLDARRRELSRLGGAGRPDRIAASVRIETPAAGEVQIELSYLLYGASWRPRYDARVDAAAGRVKLTQQALVSQSTARTGRTSRSPSRRRVPRRRPACPTSQTPGTSTSISPRRSRHPCPRRAPTRPERR